MEVQNACNNGSAKVDKRRDEGFILAGEITTTSAQTAVVESTTEGTAPQAKRNKVKSSEKKKVKDLEKKRGVRNSWLLKIFNLVGISLLIG